MTLGAMNLAACGIVFFVVLVIGAVSTYAKPVYPTKTYKHLFFVVSAVTAFLFIFKIHLYSCNPWVIGSILLGLAVASPIAGRFESRRHGQAVYEANRFRGHLATNIFGAMFAFVVWWGARSVPGVSDTFANSLLGFDPQFRVMFPLSFVVPYVFVRWQQEDAFRKKDSKHEIDEEKESSREKKIVGFSLSHWHQRINFLHLVFATSVASTSGLLLLAHYMKAASDGRPAVPLWVIGAILFVLGFLFVCGSSWSRNSRAVYLTFLTGTPAALGMAIFWLSWFRANALRNYTMVALASFGYVFFCVEAVQADWARDGKRGCPPLHYFAPMVVALVIAMFLCIAYFSPR